jgi:hypothetical protein
MKKTNTADPSYWFKAFCVIISFFMPVIAFAAEGDFLSKFHPFISVQETYNDNLNLTRDNKRDDFITTVSPGLKFSTMDKSAEPTGIDLDYRLGLVFYNRDTDKNYVSHNGNLFAKYNTKEHWSFSIRDSFTRSDEPRESQYFTAPEESQYVLATRHDRRVYWRNVVAPNVEYRFGREDKVGINYRNNIYRGLTEDVENSREDYVNPYIDFWFNQNNGIRLEYGYTKGDFETSPDFSGHKGILRYTYRFNPRTSTFLEYDYSRKNFDISTSDYDVHEGYLGITHKFSAVFNGEAQAGYFAQRRDTGSNNEGFSYKGSLSYLQKLTTFGMRVQGGYTEDYFTSENLGFNKYHRVTGFVRHSLTPRFSIGANGNLERADFVTQNHVDWIWGVGGTASYLPFKWLSLSLDVSHRQRTSNVDVYDYTENRVTLSLTATY